jgi:hypothetical protein
MKANLNIEIECGGNTCASEPGKFCRFLGTTHFGTRPVCRLFPTPEDSHASLKEKDGWVQRCKACLEVSQEAEREQLEREQFRIQLSYWTEKCVRAREQRDHYREGLEAITREHLGKPDDGERMNIIANRTIMP